jgi:adenosylcobinamide-GDP ribazoletransferase
MRGLILALQFLTRLPTPQVEDFRADDLARASPWFPAVGLIVGALLAGAQVLGTPANPWLGALSALVFWVWVTGALHLDGLADLCDALGASHRDRDRFFEVLRDPHLGSFGVIALVLALLSKLVLLALIAAAPSAWALLLLAPAWARLGPLVWTLVLPPIHPGMGERFAWQPARSWAWLWALCLFAASALLCPALITAPLWIAGWTWFLHRRLNGQCGDALGAGVEIVEIGLLLCAAVHANLS